jgi:DNA polymerase III subunit epsilon
MSEPLATPRQRVLYEAREIWKAGYVTFDTETTGLSEIDEIIQWAVCDQNGVVLGQGYIKPTVPISDGVQEIHGISQEQLQDAPAFDQAWPAIRDLTAGKVVVIYNAGYDIRMLYQSAEPYKIDMYEHVKGMTRYCAMELFAEFYGEYNEWRGSYAWQRLTTAIAYLDIEVPGSAHDAGYDASATALVIKKLAEMADAELPQGWHPPVNVACAGGCGIMKECAEADSVWYCHQCGVLIGLFHTCPGCGIQVVETRDLQELCKYCDERLHREKMLLTGQWHWCPGKYCSRYSVIKSPDLDEQCEHCQRQANWKRQTEERERERQERIAKERKGARIASQVRYRERQKEIKAENAARSAQGLPPLEKPQPVPAPTNFAHNGHEFTRSKDEYGKPLVTCSLCLQVWRKPPSAYCLKKPTYQGWEAKPEGWHTMTKLRSMKLQPKEPNRPSGYVVTMKAIYNIYEISQCIPVESKQRRAKKVASGKPE